MSKCSVLCCKCEHKYLYAILPSEALKTQQITLIFSGQCHHNNSEILVANITLAPIVLPQARAMS